MKNNDNAVPDCFKLMSLKQSIKFQCKEMVLKKSILVIFRQGSANYKFEFPAWCIIFVLLKKT